MIYLYILLKQNIVFYNLENLSTNRIFLFSSDKHTRTYFWDITDLDAPELKSVYYSEKQSIDHNLYIVQDYAYQSNYEAGLRILEIFEADHSLEQRAYFQVFSASINTRKRKSLLPGIVSFY